MDQDVYSELIVERFEEWMGNCSFLVSGFNFHMFDESLLCRSIAFARGNTSG